MFLNKIIHPSIVYTHLSIQGQGGDGVFLHR